MLTSRSLAALVGTLALVACGSDAVQSITTPATGADVKFFNFGINAPSVNFFANDTLKVTATSSTSGTESTTGTAFAGVGNGGFYSALPTGTYTFKGKNPANGDVISSTPATVDDGKAYSVYLSGFYNATTKSVESFMVEDPIPATIDPGFTYVRFVNASPNSSPLTLFAKSTTSAVETPVGGTVAYKTAGAFVTLPPGAYDLRGRATGAASDAVTRTAVSFNAGRVYTIAVFGDYTVTGTTAATRIRLDNTANR